MCELERRQNTSIEINHYSNRCHLEQLFSKPLELDSENGSCVNEALFSLDIESNVTNEPLGTPFIDKDSGRALAIAKDSLSISRIGTLSNP